MNQDASTEVRESTTGFATFRWVALAAVIVATVAGAFYYWRHVELYPTTENAYTGSNIVRVASEVSGPVIRVYVRTDDPVKAGDHPACGMPGTVARQGDLRYSFMYWVSKPQPAGPLGFGPSYPDPITGEIFSASAYVYGAGLDTYAQNAVDIVDLLT